MSDNIDFIFKMVMIFLFNFIIVSIIRPLTFSMYSSSNDYKNMLKNKEKSILLTIGILTLFLILIFSVKMNMGILSWIIILIKSMFIILLAFGGEFLVRIYIFNKGKGITKAKKRLSSFLKDLRSFRFKNLVKSFQKIKNKINAQIKKIK